MVMAKVRKKTAGPPRKAARKKKHADNDKPEKHTQANLSDTAGEITAHPVIPMLDKLCKAHLEARDEAKRQNELKNEKLQQLGEKIKEMMADGGLDNAVYHCRIGTETFRCWVEFGDKPHVVQLKETKDK